MNLSRYVYWGFLVAVLSLWVNINWAADVNNLFKVALPAHSQKANEKQKLIQQGLKLVLVRATGQPKLLQEHPKLEQALDHADQYVQSFYFSRTAQQDKQQAPLSLHISFQSQPIHQLLQQYNLPIWGQDRPLVLIWVVDRSGLKPTIISDTDKSGTVGYEIAQKAHNLRLPIVLPLMDVIDYSHITPGQLIKGDSSVILKASKRYYPNAIAVVTFHKQANEVVSNWRVWFDKQAYQWQHHDTDKLAMVQSGIAQLTSTLASRSSVTNHNPSPKQITLHLQGVQSLKDLSKSQDVLKDIAGVKSVEMSHLDNNQAVYQITINSNLNSFVQKLDFNDHLSYNKTITKDGSTIIEASYL